MIYQPTTEQVRKRREVTGRGLGQCQRDLQVEWLLEQIAALPHGRMRNILETMLALDDGAK